jgi:adenosine kinase
MPALICGSLAFDNIFTFPGRFAQQILPDRLHSLSVSFLVPTMRREYGGCAGNIAYSLHQLGGEPVVMATLGNDGGDYLARMTALGMDLSLVRQAEDVYSANCVILNDEGGNQITAFHLGAMERASQLQVPTDRSELRIGIIAPNDRQAMWQQAAQMHAAGIPFIFDPGQGLPMFDGKELQRFIDLATWVAVNDYEGQMLCERTGHTLQSLSRTHLKGVVMTLAAQGAEVWIDGQRELVAGVPAAAVVDPTGCGDAFRAALLYGLERDWDLLRCVRLGNRVGAIKIAHRGGQNHRFDGVLEGA